MPTTSAPDIHRPPADSERRTASGKSASFWAQARITSGHPAARACDATAAAMAPPAPCPATRSRPESAPSSAACSAAHSSTVVPSGAPARQDTDSTSRPRSSLRLRQVASACGPAPAPTLQNTSTGTGCDAASGRDLAYTTVATLVRILVEKGFLRQTNDERPFRFEPLRSFEEVSGNLLTDLVRR